MTHNCPVCKKWIECGLRRTRATLDKHIKAEHPETAKVQAAVRAEFISGEDVWGLEKPKAAITAEELSRITVLKLALSGAAGVRKAQIASQIKRLEAKQQ